MAVTVIAPHVVRRRKRGHEDARQHAGERRSVLAVTCEPCHHESVLGADDWSDAVLVRAFRPHMVCTRCIVSADARPNWREMKAQGSDGLLCKIRPPVWRSGNAVAI